MSHELEEEALQREKEQEHQVRAGQAAAAAKERQQAEELRAKDQQVTELQVRNKTKRLHLFGVNSMRSLDENIPGCPAAAGQFFFHVLENVSCPQAWDVYS